MSAANPETRAALAKWTPGPWRVSGVGIHAIVRGDDQTIVAVRHRLPREVHEANARLIAAAPDLYEALAEIVAEWGYPNTPKWHRARAALAKAR